MSIQSRVSASQPVSGRIPFDSAIWQVQDTGDFIHTKTGEVRDEDGFLSEADDTGDGAASGDIDAPQDGGGWQEDDAGGGGFDDAGGSAFHGDPDAQVRSSAHAADTGADRPSRLAPKRRR